MEYIARLIGGTGVSSFDLPRAAGPDSETAGREIPQDGLHVHPSQRGMEKKRPSGSGRGDSEIPILGEHG